MEVVGLSPRLHSDLTGLFSQLLDSDQELYRNFPLTISERWQQEVTETVFDTVNAETDKLEARKRAKNKQLGHEEGESRGSDWSAMGTLTPNNCVPYKERVLQLLSLTS